jgi:hypothetical protein
MIDHDIEEYLTSSQKTMLRKRKEKINRDNSFSDNRSIFQNTNLRKRHGQQ